MNILQYIDFDKVALPLLKEISVAISLWLKGAPRSESALTNRITELLGRERRQCEVGVYPGTTLKLEKYLLDRQALDNSDLYGADIAITVIVNSPSSSIIKTALIQLKVSDDFEVRLDFRQMLDGIINTITAERAFVLAVDRERRGAIRVRMTKEIYDPHSSFQTRGFNTENWMTFTPWLHDWLACRIGAPSDPTDPRSIETALSKLVNYYGATPDEVFSEMDLRILQVQQWFKFTVSTRHDIAGEERR